MDAKLNVYFKGVAEPEIDAEECKRSNGKWNGSACEVDGRFSVEVANIPVTPSEFKENLKEAKEWMPELRSELSKIKGADGHDGRITRVEVILSGSEMSAESCKEIKGAWSSENKACTLADIYNS
jgi:hypothetical protein